MMMMIMMLIDNDNDNDNDNKNNNNDNNNNNNNNNNNININNNINNNKNIINNNDNNNSNNNNYNNNDNDNDSPPERRLTCSERAVILAPATKASIPPNILLLLRSTSTNEPYVCMDSGMTPVSRLLARYRYFKLEAAPRSLILPVRPLPTR